MGIYDAMMLCRADVNTYCFGLAASMGAFLLGAGKRGKRNSMPNSRIMIHQPLGGASGQAVDIEIQVRGQVCAEERAGEGMGRYGGSAAKPELFGGSWRGGGGEMRSRGPRSSCRGGRDWRRRRWQRLELAHHLEAAAELLYASATAAEHGAPSRSYSHAAA